MIWKDIQGFDGLYQASSTGLIRNTNTLSLMIGSPNEKGYLRVSLKNKKGWKTYKVHRLVALTFLPNTNNKKEINHKNGNKTDNRVSNLEWVDHKDNMQHAWETGLIKNAGRKRKRVVMIKNGQKHIYKDVYIASKELNIPVYVIRFLCANKIQVELKYEK